MRAGWTEKALDEVAGLGHGVTVSAPSVTALRTLLGMPELLTPEVYAWMMSATSRDQALPSLEDLAQRPAWMKRAQCRGEDRALFFPALGEKAAKARAICSICPVRQECLSYALADPESAGVWGGTAERERRKLARSVA